VNNTSNHPRGPPASALLDTDTTLMHQGLSDRFTLLKSVVTDVGVETYTALHLEQPVLVHIVTGGDLAEEGTLQERLSALREADRRRVREVIPLAVGVAVVTDYLAGNPPLTRWLAQRASGTPTAVTASRTVEERPEVPPVPLPVPVPVPTPAPLPVPPPLAISDAPPAPPAPPPSAPAAPGLYTEIFGIPSAGGGGAPMARQSGGEAAAEKDLFDEFFLPKKGPSDPQPLPPPLPPIVQPLPPVATPRWPSTTEDGLPGWLPQPEAGGAPQPLADPLPAAPGGDSRGSATAVPILEVPPASTPRDAPHMPPMPWGGVASPTPAASDFDRLIRQSPLPLLPGAATAGGAALPPGDRKVPAVLWHLLSYLLIAGVVLAGLVFPRFSVPSGIRLPVRADSLLAVPAVVAPGR